MPTQNEIDTADSKVRDAVREWLALFERDHPGAIAGDFVAVLHLRKFIDADAGEPMDPQDQYEVLYPWGSPYHSILGLLQAGVDDVTGDEMDMDPE